MNSKYAPIAIFVYNRPKHTLNMLNSLIGNPEFHDSPVYIYCDGPKKNELNKQKIIETRNIVRKFVPKNAVIIEREENRGLANSIIEGVTELCNEFGRVIVIEDDLELSPKTLNYLNKALEEYKDNEKVMHIAAYMYPVEKPHKLPETFFYQEATCWGWATWQRAWNHFEPDSGKLLEYINKNSLKAKFDKENTMYFYEMLKNQNEGRVDSWAIRWYSTIFINNGLSLHPAKSFVENKGNDNTGTNCGKSDIYSHKQLNNTEINLFPKEITENLPAYKMIQKFRNKYHKQNFFQRFFFFIQRTKKNFKYLFK